MDELMRKAAADYPVKPHGLNWDKVAQQLDALDGVAPEKKSNGGSKKLLLLLPFILLSYVCDRFMTYEYGHLKKSDAVNTINKTGVKPAGPTGTNTTETAGVKVTGSKTKAATTLDFPANSGERPVAMNSLVVRNNPERGTMGFLKSSAPMVSEKSATAYSSAPLFFTAAGVAQQATITANIKHTPISGKQAIAVTEQMPALKKQTGTSSEKAYASLLFGPDFSRVKAQAMRPAGYSIGTLLGYRFHKKWAVEAGIFWDKKKYFSEGEYFKTDKINLPQHAKVMQIDGYCEMFELPLNIRYTLIDNKRSSITVAAGVSSYLMKKENYDYVYRQYNVDYSGTSNYDNASKNWFSIANLGIGYEHQVGSNTKLHVEPYIKLPLQGVGIGSLPLRSAGVLIGVTRRIY